MQQVLVTGHYADGSVRDLTRVCDLRLEVADIATLSATGFLQPAKTDTTTLIFQAGEQTAGIAVVVEELDKPRPVTTR